MLGNMPNELQSCTINMSKYLFEKTKVVHNKRFGRFDIYYKNFLFWKYECCQPYDIPGRTRFYGYTEKQAEEAAIQTAKDMLDTVEVYRGTNFLGYYY